MPTLIADIESDGFLDEMTRIWTIQLGDADTDEVTVYADQVPYAPLSAAVARMGRADRVVFHNGIKFDFPAIEKLYPGFMPREQLFDTLVAARLLNPEERANSLDAWGARLGVAKGTYTGDFKSFTPELVTYAKQDIVVTRALYHKVKHVETWGRSLQIEHDVAWAIAAQERNGFRFNVRAAVDLEVELREQKARMSVPLQDTFPPIWKPVEVFTPKGNNKAMGYVKDCPLTKVKLETFNPASRQQVAKRLQNLGWKPKEFGPAGDPTVDEKVLASLPYPEAQRLVQFYGIQKKLGMLSDGKNGWLKLVKPDGRVYGAVNPNGACTGRMSHSHPNMAQVDSDHRMRELWLPREGWKQVGADADGLEARMLAHYLARYDGGAFTEMLLNGSKENGTDVHSSNARAVNRVGYKVNRDGAKTLLYALIYGAGDAKLGMTVIENLREQGLAVPKAQPRAMGDNVRKALATSMKGIDRLTADIQAKVKAKGYVVGLDGRHLFIRSEHAALNTLLQGAGAIVMKLALNMFMEKLGEAHGITFGLCANVHDEVQMECCPEDAEMFGKDFVNCITTAGVELNLRCPLSGTFQIGDNWSQTH